VKPAYRARTILLVDDDEILIEVDSGDPGDSAGYQVLTAFNGREAIEIYEAWEGDIDLVMLDMIMPGMGGAETFRKLRDMDPQVSVIIVSGYSLPDAVASSSRRDARDFCRSLS